MSEPEGTNGGLLQDVTTWAMSSDALLAAARSLPIGGQLRFVPSSVKDASPVQQPSVGNIESAFSIRRIALSEIPSEYGVLESELLPGSFAFLVASEASPATYQLAIIEPGQHVA